MTTNRAFRTMSPVGDMVRRRRRGAMRLQVDRTLLNKNEVLADPTKQRCVSPPCLEAMALALDHGHT